MRLLKNAVVLAFTLVSVAMTFATDLQVVTEFLNAEVSRNYPELADDNYEMISLVASCGEFFPNATPTSKGVYPVKLEWNVKDSSIIIGDFKVEVYKIALKKSLPQVASDDDSFFKVASSTVKKEKCWDFDEEAVPCMQYAYVMVVKNAKDKAIAKSNVALGYGGLTGTRYYLEFEKLILSSHSKLTIMHRTPDIRKLGEETIQGDTGSCFYDSHIAGFGADINIAYTNYYDDIFPTTNAFILTGNSDVSVSLLSNGMMKGIVTSTGLFKGGVDYSNIVIEGGVAAGGYYVIYQPNQEPKKIVWNIPRDEV